MKKGIKRIVTAALAAVLMVTQLPAINSKAANQYLWKGACTDIR